MISFRESGMEFVFAEACSFYIEKSRLYDKKLNAKGISAVECITVRGKNMTRPVLFIEAKSSAPNPDGVKGNGRFKEFIEEVSHKFIHSISICYAILHQIQSLSQDEYPMGKILQDCLMKKPHIVFVLIIKKHKAEWCGQVQDSLNSHLRKLHVIWNTQVFVLNEELAREKKLIQ